MADFRLIIEPLAKQHKRTDFDCGVPALNRYLAKQAGQDIKRSISRVFVAVSADCPETILGYYTLSSLSIDLSELPESLVRKLPHHPIPAALLGRLAISTQVQGKGIGKLLLADALKRILAVSRELAIYALVVDAIDEAAGQFYQHFGLMPLGAVEDNRWFLPLRSALTT
ncbi:GNAT family N-acetyltransferase [Stenoxybacter acetivorans]|uniref:GNAT family N-acetyltransferase n=1 Tax=Stenoxybacter acetivorans TaxID=422441 RepID=UPI0005616DEA|nr:GNAT family N-acetyltransferase [Stenoxybacter acetivorans]